MASPSKSTAAATAAPKPLGREAWLDRFVHGPWLTEVDEAVRTAWRSWAVSRGVRLVGVHLPAQGLVEAEVVRVALRRSALGDAQTPVLVDVVVWLLTATRWIAFSVVIDRDPPGPAPRTEISLVLDAIARRTVRSVGVSDLAGTDGQGAGDQPLQVEFDLEGPGLIGLRGRRWPVGDELIGVDGEGASTSPPFFRGRDLPPDLAHFLSVLSA